MTRAANRRVVWGAITVVAALCAGCSSTKGTQSASGAAPGYKVGKPYKIKGIWYYPEVDYGYSEVGVASWYGPGFDGKATANGETYDMNDLTAAHKTLPMPCVVRVTNLENGRSIKLRVNDRGPFVGDRIIDVSRRGAQLLGFYTAGTAQVRVDIIEDESRVLAGDIPVPAQPGADQPVEQAVASRESEPEIGQVSPAVEQQATTASPADTSTQPYSVSGYAATADAAPAYTVSEQPPSYTTASYGSPTTPYNASYTNDTTAYAPATETAYNAPAADYYPRQGTAVATPRTASYEHVSSGYYVQAGAFSEAWRADRVRQQLSAIGPTQVTPSRVNGHELLRVRMGPYDAGADVERALSQASRAGFPEARIVAD